MSDVYTLIDLMYSFFSQPLFLGVSPLAIFKVGLSLAVFFTALEFFIRALFSD